MIWFTHRRKAMSESFLSSEVRMSSKQYDQSQSGINWMKSIKSFMNLQNSLLSMEE